MPRLVLATGQERCYDQAGFSVPCGGSGQDGEVRSGVAWPEERFVPQGEVVRDRLTGLVWSRSANLAGFPLTWLESLAFVQELNRETRFGFADWRLPNRCELRSLMSYQARKPALPAGHPFQEVFLGWYWSSTSAAINPAYAWYLHLEGARMFYGRKDQYCLVWPVRAGDPTTLPRTGQDRCYDQLGREIACAGSGQDGEIRFGAPWPEERFVVQGEVVLDRLTDLCWPVQAGPLGRGAGWGEGLEAIRMFNRQGLAGRDDWRLPNINELASLVDCRRYQPALPASHPFQGVQEVYWSSTTSFFEPDWAWALYLDKGALGVGYKPRTRFAIWPVSDVSSQAGGRERACQPLLPCIP